MRASWMLVFLGWMGVATAQPLEWLWEPSVTHTLSLNDRHSLLSQFNAVQSDEELVRIEGSMYLNRRIRVRTTLTGGYLIRLTTPLEERYTIEHRPTIQASHTYPAGIHQISHRGRIELRIRESGDILRARYRLSVRTPLQGERLDPGERYLLIQDELLASHAMESGTRTTDNRASVHMGWLLMNRQRVEVGLQHRWEGIGSGAPKHRMHIGTTWHFTR